MQTQVRTRGAARAVDPTVERAANVARPKVDSPRRPKVYRSHALRPEEFHDIVAKGRRP